MLRQHRWPTPARDARQGLAVEPPLVDNARHPRAQERTDVVAAAARPSCVCRRAVRLRPGRRRRGARLSLPSDWLVVGFAAGGTTDFMARLVADKLREPLGQMVVVENRTGANGSLGAEFVAKAEPTATRSISRRRASPPSIRTWAPARRTTRSSDFVAVGRVAFNSTMLVVNAATPVRSAHDLATLAREKPGRITIAITGLGSVSHLGPSCFRRRPASGSWRCPIAALRPP